MATTTNYFVGRDSGKWRTGIRNYGAVKYEHIYPGVDLLFHGRGRELEYDILVNAGADTSKVRFVLEGFTRVGVTEDGSLVLTTPDGVLMQGKPLVYEEHNNDRRRIEGRYVLLGGSKVGFAIGEHRKRERLIIDPVLSYATYLGGAGDDAATAITVDRDGNTYITGYTGSPNFPLLNAWQALNGGGTDIFVTKINAAGTAIIYSTLLGGSGDDQGMAIAVDGSGNAYITGSTVSNNFPLTAGAFQTHGNAWNYSSAFVAKLSASGSTLLYSTYLGGDGPDRGKAIAVDPSGVYVAGDSGGQHFPTTPGAFQTFALYGGGFLAKFNAGGTTLEYSTMFGGTGYGPTNITGLAVDNSSAPYLTGDTYDGLPTTPGVFQPNVIFNNGIFYQHAFVTKFKPDATGLIYSTYLGGSDSDHGRGIAVDSAGNAYVSGDTFSPDFPVTAILPGSSSGNVFVSKLNPTGSALVYSTRFGSNGATPALGAPDTRVAGMALNSSLEVIVAGSTGSPDFPVTAGAPETMVTNGAVSSGFVSKLNAAGSALLYSTFLGDTSCTSSVVVDSAGSAYVAGWSSNNCPVSLNALQGGISEGADAFISKISDGTCSASIFPTAAVIGVNGGSVDVAVTSDPGCNWVTVLPGAVGYGSRARVVLGGSGVGNGSVQLTVAGNPGGLWNEIISIAGNAFTLSQQSSCAYNVSFIPSPLTSEGGLAGSFKVFSAPTCPITALSSANWLMVGYSSQNGAGSGSFTANPNFDSATRSATVTIADQDFTITQQGGYVCKYNVAPSNLSTTAAGGIFSVAVTTASSCNWTATANDSWLRIISAYPSTESGNVVFSVAQNPGRTRTGSLTIAGQTLTLAQTDLRPSKDDFDMNGIPDLVWLNNTTRQVTVNYFGGQGGEALLGWNWLSAAGSPGWHVVAAADFNGDGVPDLVWQNDSTGQVAVDYYGGSGGATFIGWNWLDVKGEPGWRVVAAADFNGDGVPDLVWENQSTNQVVLWYMGGVGGAVFEGWTYLVAGSPGWHIAGAADFNRDGVPDLIWQNNQTVQVTVNYYGGAGGGTLLGWAYLDSKGEPGWTLAGAADFNGDGVPDLIWENLSSNEVAVWYMGGAGGAVMQNWAILMTGSPGWAIVNH